MLRYSKTDDRPKNHRSSVSHANAAYLYSRYFFQKKQHSQNFRLLVPTADIPNPTNPEENLRLPKFNGDVHYHPLLNLDNFQTLDNKIYHHVRRRSCRLPENDILIDYKFKSTDFTQTQLNILGDIRFYIDPNNKATWAAFPRPFTFYRRFGLDHFEKSNPGETVPVAITKYKAKSIESGGIFTNIENFLLGIANFFNPIDRLTFSTAFYLPPGTYGGDSLLAQGLEDEVFDQSKNSFEFWTEKWAVICRYFRYWQVQDRPVHLLGLGFLGRKFILLWI